MTKLWRKTLGLFLLAYLFYWPIRLVILPLINVANAPAFLNFSFLYNLPAAFIIVLLVWIVAKRNKKYTSLLFLSFGAIKLMLFILLAKKWGFDLSPSLFLLFIFPFAAGLGIEIFFMKHILDETN